MDLTSPVSLRELAIMTNEELATLYSEANAKIAMAHEANPYSFKEFEALEHNAANSLDILLGRMDRMARSAVLRVNKTYEDMTIDELMDGYAQDMVTLYTVHPEAWDHDETLSQDTPKDTFALYGGSSQFGEEHRNGYLTVFMDRLNGVAQQRLQDAGYTVN